MDPRIALLRLVEDEEAPIMPRVRALEKVPHPPLALLRRLLVEPETPRSKPVPSKLRAVATHVYWREMELRRIRKESAKKKQGAGGGSGNALGI